MGFDDNFILDVYKKDITKKADFKNQNKKKELHLARLIQDSKTEDEKRLYIGKLIEPHLSYALHEASKLYHTQTFSRDLFSLPDFVSWANEGLIRAAEKYDPNSDNRFLSYACNWIRQSVRYNLAIFKNTVYHPITAHVNAYKEKYVCDKYYKDNGFLPQIGDKLIYTNSNDKQEEVEVTYNYMMNRHSFDDPIKENESTSFGDCLADENVEEYGQDYQGILNKLEDILDSESFTLHEKYIFKKIQLEGNNLDTIGTSLDYIYKFNTPIFKNLTEDEKTIFKGLIEIRDSYVDAKCIEGVEKILNSEQWITITSKYLAEEIFKKNTCEKIRQIKEKARNKIKSVAFLFEEYI